MRKTFTAVLMLLASVGVPSPCGAESLYVIDRLLIGVHEAKTRDSAILQVIPTGTLLEELGREGEFVKVKTPDGVEGWVDANYVTDEMPAQLIVAELEAWKKTRKEELDAAWKEVETLRARLEQKTPPADLAEVNGALKEMQRLQEENRALKDKLAVVGAELEVLRDQAANGEALPQARDGAGAASAAAAPAAVWLLPTWQWVVAGVVFALGLVLGAWQLDARQRRRHGGFRV